jgi:hypothetical protein
MDTPAVRRALRGVISCHSFRGHDFAEVILSGGLGRRRAKKTTTRSVRRLSRALTRETE